MGYKQIGIDKNGVKKFRITIELGKDLFGKRDRYYETFCGSVAEVKIRDAELTKQYYHKGNVANVKDITFAQYSKIFLERYCEGNVRITTINNYKRLLKYILPYIGHLKLNKITHIILEEMYKKLKQGIKGKELSYNSMYDYYKVINVMFNQAVNLSLLEENPNLKVKKLKKTKTEQKFYNLEQVSQLLSCLENENIKYKALITLALDSGARRGEIVALKWDDLDFNTGSLKIDNSLKVVKGVVDEKKAKTESSNRIIYLTTATLDILKEYKEWQDNCKSKLGKLWKNENRIFTDELGGYMNPGTCHKIFTKIINIFGK